jgi:uncharacterized membrane protein (DUF485 family)
MYTDSPVGNSITLGITAGVGTAFCTFVLAFLAA